MAFLQSKLDYLENKSRQSNLLIVGVPEGSAGTDCSALIQDFMPEVLGVDQFMEPLCIERSHRSQRVRTQAAK